MKLADVEPSKNVEDRRKEKKRKIPSLGEIAAGMADNAPDGSIPKKSGAPKGWGKASSGW